MAGQTHSNKIESWSEKIHQRLDNIEDLLRQYFLLKFGQDWDEMKAAELKSKSDIDLDTQRDNASMPRVEEQNLYLDPVFSSTTAPVTLTVIEDEQLDEAKISAKSIPISPVSIFQPEICVSDNPVISLKTNKKCEEQPAAVLEANIAVYVVEELAEDQIDLSMGYDVHDLAAAIPTVNGLVAVNGEPKEKKIVMDEIDFSLNSHKGFKDVVYVHDHSEIAVKLQKDTGHWEIPLQVNEGALMDEHNNEILYPFKLFYVNKKGKNMQNSTMPLLKNQKEGISLALRQESSTVIEGILKEMGVEKNIQLIALVLAKCELQVMVNESYHESSSFPDSSAIFTMIMGTLIICSMVAVIQRVSEAAIYVCDSNFNYPEILMEMGKRSCYEAPQWFIVTQIGEAGEDELVNKLINQDIRDFAVGNIKLVPSLFDFDLHLGDSKIATLITEIKNVTDAASLMPLWEELEWRDHIEYKFGELVATIMVFNLGICENFAADYVVESLCGGGLVYTWLSPVSTIDGELGVSMSAPYVKNILVEIIIFIFDPGGGSSLECKWNEFVANLEDKVVLMEGILIQTKKLGPLSPIMKTHF
ncbi:DNA repair protein RAD16-like [Senna tora]|uniref:DNA repair protein RAD16-like n=1 Tax=Senna tora TaxID=362788 RepID=A0A834WHL9_9FABA|nr:DNA repair protein RAD16-like [Senna tora]